MWIKHHSWRQLFCTHSLTLKICVATIAICFLGHPVEMPPVLAAALASSCSTRCTVPGKHQLQPPTNGYRGSLNSTSSNPTVRGGGSLDSPSSKSAEERKGQLLPLGAGLYYKPSSHRTRLMIEPC